MILQSANTCPSPQTTTDLFKHPHKDANPQERQRAERITLRLVGVCFMLLAVYLVLESGRSLIQHYQPERSIPGIAITVVSFVVMIVLSRAKRTVARQIGSVALNADATQTALCSYLSAITLGGLALNFLFGWWWADPTAALLMVPIIGHEAVEALRGKECGCAKEVRE